MKKNHGFTLVELLVVIAIIGILAGIIAPKLFGGMDSAKEQQCRNNLKQLHTGVLHYAIDKGGRVPSANGFEFWGNGEPDGRNGWVAWIPDDLSHPLEWHKGGYGGQAQEPKFVDDLGIGDPNDDGFPARWAIHHGSIWEYVKNESCYACPVTKRLKDKWRTKDEEDEDTPDWEVYRTYVMNGYFGGSVYRRAWSTELQLDKIGTKQGGNESNTQTDYISGWTSMNPNADLFHHFPQASRLLLFSEGLPSPNFKNPSRRRKKTEDYTIEPYNCAIYPKSISEVQIYKKELQWRSHGKRIMMGFPKSEMICGMHDPLILYKGGGESVFLGSALAIFFDGHIEKVFPVYESSDGVADRPVNAAWFLCRGLRPAESVPNY